jgi:hypothetical protein
MVNLFRMGLIQPFNYLTYTASPALGVTAQAGKRPFKGPGGPFRPENDMSFKRRIHRPV